MRYLVAIMLMTTFIVACTFDKAEVPVPAPLYCDTLPATYSAHISVIISTNCTGPGCHQAGSSEGDLTTYFGVKQKASSGKLRQRVLVDKTMPPTGPLSREDIMRLECWLASGAPEN
jgi:hypothetical protein